MNTGSHSRWTGGACATARSRPGAPRGFTLIEVMITVVIIAILSMIAYPSYQGQVAKARRAEMQGELVRLAQFMERIYTESGCYNPTAAGTCGANGVAPAISTGSRYYTVNFSAGPTASTFTIQATPISGGPQSADGFMQINHLGQRFWDKDNGGSIGTGEDTWTR